MTHLHGLYLGPDKLLKYEQAILQEGPGDTYLAQFDNLNLEMDLTHNWTSFPKEDWKILNDPRTPSRGP